MVSPIFVLKVSNDITKAINGLVTRKATGWMESVSEKGQELRGNK